MDEQILSKLPKEQFKTVLDVGSGGGKLTYWFAYNGYNVVGIEPDTWYRNLVNKFMKKQGMSNCQIVDGDIHDIRFPDKSFDVVVCNNVIEHLHEVETAIGELIRCARILCIVTTPYGFEANSADHIQHFFDDDIDRLFGTVQHVKKKVYDKPSGNQVFIITVDKAVSQKRE